MEHAVGILMLALGALILIYAGLLGYVKNPAFIPRSHFAKIRDPQQYAKQFAKLLALVGLGPVVGGLVGLFAGNAAAGIVTFVGIVAALCFSGRIMRDVL